LISLILEGLVVYLQKLKTSSEHSLEVLSQQYYSTAYGMPHLNNRIINNIQFDQMTKFITKNLWEYTYVQIINGRITFCIIQKQPHLIFEASSKNSVDIHSQPIPRMECIKSKISMKYCALPGKTKLIIISIALQRILHFLLR
jgi:hypothetical protein